jgi:hypothetical protein
VKKPTTAAAGVAVAWLAVALTMLARGEPHEDAFILFKYARNLAGGSGIAYYPGGPHAEGATDFLWLLLVAAAARAHVGVAVGAALLNAAGVWVAAWLLVEPTVPARAGGFGVRAAASVFLLVAPCAVASYVGFSAALYSACALLLYRTYVRGRAIWLLPLGFVVALMRPDGVLFATGFALLGATRLRPREVRDYAVAAFVTVALGVAYFAWRAWYFGLLLPLPLYVKSHYAGLPPGVGETLDWLASSVAPLAGAYVAGALLLGKNTAPQRRLALGLAPFALHAFAFAASVPSQNVGNRFESPDTLALFYALVQVTSSRARAARTAPAIAWLGALALAFVPLVPIERDVFHAAFEHSYVTRFARALADVAPRGSRLAVTEAGRIPYFASAEVLDLVGLNSAETARVPPSRALLERFAPDLVMVHPAGLFDERLIVPGTDVVPLAPPLSRLVIPYGRGFMADALPPYADLHAENVRVAPAAAMAFLDAHAGDYDLFAVRFESRFVHYHLYAVRRGWSAHDAVVGALEEAKRTARRPSYLDLEADRP